MSAGGGRDSIAAAAVRSQDAWVRMEFVRGDTLISGYRSRAGEMLLEQTDIGPERRLAVLGSYFVPGSTFREGSLDSLLDDEGC